MSKFLKEIIWLMSLITLGLGAGLFSIYFFGTPDVSQIKNYPFKLTSVLYDRSGEHELYRLYDEENRIMLSHEEIPDTLRLATIASEDTQFYVHHGIDPLAILRALKANLESGDIRQGGSTITQQLARTLFLTREQTLLRKIREAFLAIKIDQHVSKDVILDLYLNAIPYGANAYGAETAAETFFQKHATDLSLDESALLAALPNAPTYFSPYQEHTQELYERQKNILQKMYTLGFITQEELAAALKKNTSLAIAPRKTPIVAPHFVFYVLDELKKTYSTEELSTEGLRVITSLDLKLQTTAETVVREGAIKNVARGAENAALVSLDPKTGEILAMVGSRDYFDKAIDGNVNVTIQKRQPGSAFKPFAYATAFEKGFQPETPIYDRPINFGPDGSGHDYIPRNYDGKFHGLLTMRQALAMSLNVPAVQTLALAGVDDTIALATRLGITTLTDPKRYGLALVLGGAEVRPIDMASAFSVFSQEGIRHDITLLLAISDRSGKKHILTNPQAGTAVLNPEIARKINSILSDNAARTPIFGAHSPLAFPAGITVAAKTGTTQNFRDAWTVGYTPSIATAVWAGNNDNHPMNAGADGIFVAAPIWRAFMDQALKRFPETGFTAYTPSERYKNTLPIASSPRTIYINNKTGREIPESEAKKMKKGRYKSYQVSAATGSSFEPLPPLPEENPSDIISMNDIQKLYESAP